MIKSELIKTVAKEAGTTQEVAKKATDAVFSTIEKTLAEGNKVSLQGFGTFYLTRMPAIERANPLQGGKIVQVPARNRVFFRPSEKVKESVNQ